VWKDGITSVFKAKIKKGRNQQKSMASWRRDVHPERRALPELRDVTTQKTAHVLAFCNSVLSMFSDTVD
jgi:hypothetical protein